MSAHREQIEAIDAELLDVQREYIKKSIGLYANELALIEEETLKVVRGLRAKRSAIVRRMKAGK